MHTNLLHASVPWGNAGDVLTSLTACDHPDSIVIDDNGHTFLHFQYIEDTGAEIHRHTSPLCLDLCSAGLMPKLLVVRHYCLSMYLPF